MSEGLAREDRPLVIVAAALLVGATVVGLLFSPRQNRVSAGFPSSYATDRFGAKAAYLLLKELGYSEARWTSPPTDLPNRSSRVVLILADPFIPASAAERTALRWFVRRGGRVLATGPWAVKALGLPGRVAHAEPGIDEQNLKAELPGPISRGAPMIRMEADGLRIRPSLAGLQYYGDATGGAVVRYALGKGSVIWWENAMPLTNGGLTQASNLNLFLNSVGRTRGERVLWDEYFHGERAGLWTYLSRTPLPWALLQASVLALALILTYSRRSGPLAVTSEPSRLSPLEFVDTVGSLYSRKQAAAEALEIVLHRFKSRLALTSPPAGRERELPNARVDAATEAAAPGTSRLVAECEAELKTGTTSESKALQLVGRLHESSRALGWAGKGE